MSEKWAKLGCRDGGAYCRCLSLSNSVFLCSSQCFITDMNHRGAWREKGKGFCINSCLADSIYKVDCRARKYVFLL